MTSLAFESLAEAMLLTAGRWIGSGKWLVRRLREWYPDRAERLIAPMVAGDTAGFLAAAEIELADIGGRVRTDFIR